MPTDELQHDEQVAILLQHAETTQATVQQLLTQVPGLVQSQVSAALSAALQSVKLDHQALITAIGKATEAYDTSRSGAERSRIVQMVVCAGIIILLAGVVSYGLVRIRQAELDTLSVNIRTAKETLDRLHIEGGSIQFQRCGGDGRLCVRIDPTAPQYGNSTSGHYSIVYGY